MLLSNVCLPFRWPASFGADSGLLAFTLPHVVVGGQEEKRPMLLVTDAGKHAVHVVDVTKPTGKWMRGKLSVRGPRGVAASVFHVVVSAWESMDSEDHALHVFRAQV